jgi:hypothetical protein
MVHLSAADADKWIPLLYQVDAAKMGAERQVGPSVADGYKAVDRLAQSQKRLTDDEISQLVLGYRDGSTILELATRLDCDRKTVIRYLKLNCVEVRHRKMSAAQIAEAGRLYESGLSLNKIGKTVGANPKTVRARLVERGVELRSGSRTDD